MPAYLERYRPRQTQFRRPRRADVSGVIVVHTAESTPDWVGPDAGAENVAAFIRNRADYGSYHYLCDSDSTILLVPLDAEAYGDGTGSNTHAIHISAATQAAKWGQAPAKWREDTVRQMAEAAADAATWVQRTRTIRIPARRVTRSQSEIRIPGFISHGERDPGRRSDPGAAFPWDLFLRFYTEAMTGPTPNITAARKARTLPERRSAMRKVKRRGAPADRAAATAWLKADTTRTRANRRARRAFRRLKKHEVK